MIPYMEVGTTWYHARGKFYQAPPLFSCNVEKIGEPGDEANRKSYQLLLVYK